MCLFKPWLLRSSMHIFDQRLALYTTFPWCVGEERRRLTGSKRQCFLRVGEAWEMATGWRTWECITRSGRESERSWLLTIFTPQFWCRSMMKNLRSNLLKWVYSFLEFKSQDARGSGVRLRSRRGKKIMPRNLALKFFSNKTSGNRNEKGIKAQVVED